MINSIQVQAATLPLIHLFRREMFASHKVFHFVRGKEGEGKSPKSNDSDGRHKYDGKAIAQIEDMQIPRH